MKNLLIVTGPQGSGNHLFSKILALHPMVKGWSDLLSTYWIGHDEEPFSEFWTNPNKIIETSWKDGYYVTSISCPYYNNGVETIPDYTTIIENFKAAGFTVTLAIIGRDKNILAHQQQRVRNKVTIDQFMRGFETIRNLQVTFLSTELLFLYRREYLKTLAYQIRTPIDYENPMIDVILQEDPNAKYFMAVGPQPLDEQIALASKPKARQ